MPHKTNQRSRAIIDQLRLEQARVDAYRIAFTQDADVVAITRRLIDQSLELMDHGRMDLAAKNLITDEAPQADQAAGRTRGLTRPEIRHDRGTVSICRQAPR